MEPTVLASVPPPGPTPDLDARAVVRRRLQWLMGARLLSASILLGGTLWIAAPTSDGYDHFTPRLLLGLIVGIYAASLGFAVWLPRAPSLRRVAAVQIAVDLLVITALVYVSGGAASVFTFLYGVTILMAALLIGPRASRVVAAFTLLAYLLLGVSVASGWIPYPPDQPADRYLLDFEDVGFSLVSNLVGLALVAALAGTLAERLRSAGGQLRIATDAASRLARLNDDIVRSISSGILTTDENGVVLANNPAAATIFGVGERGLVGLPVDALLPVGDAVQAARGEGEGTRPDGATFPVGWNSAPLVGSEGLLFAFQDLSEIVELRTAARNAERLATLGRLAAGLAHEIRNPLSSISGSVQLVREAETLNEEDRHLLGIVLAEVDRLEDLVTTMLSVGRPRPPMREQCDLTELAAAVVAMAEQGPAITHAVEIVFEPPSDPVRAEVDGDQIRQVIWNLLKNAIQATPAGSKVVLRTAATPAGAEVSVEDQGPGISEGVRSRLFDTFFSGRDQGVGLGLALVRQIVEAHGGLIEVESREGAGATFRVVLPTRPPTKPSAEARASSPAD